MSRQRPNSGCRAVGTRVVVAICALLVTSATATAAVPRPITANPGAAGAGDPYFPLDGNGGYDTEHYVLDLSYDPATDMIAGSATIRARATQHLSRFNLDLEGSPFIRSTWTAAPRSGLAAAASSCYAARGGMRDRERFTTVIVYSGVPETLVDLFGVSGFIHTDDGALVIGQPHVAATWFPSTTIRATRRPTGSGSPFPQDSRRWRTEVLEGRAHERRPDNVDVGRPRADGVLSGDGHGRRVRAARVRAQRHRCWDAVDPDLSRPTGTPRTGSQFAISQAGEPAYKRLARTIGVPAGGATLTFWVKRDTEPAWDFVFVEAHTAGTDNWTTLRDLNGHTARHGLGLPVLARVPPVPRALPDRQRRRHLLPDRHQRRVVGRERREQRLRAVAGRPRRPTPAGASRCRSLRERRRRPALGRRSSTTSSSRRAPGTTSFEADGDTFDGWTVRERPPAARRTPTTGSSGTVADPPLGGITDGSLARQGEIIDFPTETSGATPSSPPAASSTTRPRLRFALENQTRPIYSKVFFSDPLQGDSVVVHELAHQWFGDSLAVARGSTSGSTKASRRTRSGFGASGKGPAPSQEISTSCTAYSRRTTRSGRCRSATRAPTTSSTPVYARGAMTLHQLRLDVGDKDFFEILAAGRADAGGT